MSGTSTETSDYVVGQERPNAYLLAKTRDRLFSTETIDAIKEQIDWVRANYRTNPTIRSSKPPRSASTRVIQLRGTRDGS